ncbi:MAG: 4-hydroxythreonine-4-phosphate dehydrogenase PdxA [Planctomycetes bacterium]|nr:4-hydroxythreonine-4-phosphate dehydrogenase PdxA [Planctomycetota bacterium]
MTTQRPYIALTMGDPAGIGPEIVTKALARPDLRERMGILVIGVEAARPPGLVDGYPEKLGQAGFVELHGPDAWEMGKAQASCGMAALGALQVGADMARRGDVHALVTAPVCKEALHLAGEAVEGQTELLARWDGAERYEMVAVAGNLRVMLLTRHMALRDALNAIEPESIEWHLELFDRTLRSIGIQEPRLALAGLNPHAGEGGLFGDEEARLLQPALDAVRRRGLRVSGPHPPDTVFLDGRNGKHDGVLALYHDQAFIPLKLLSEGRGVTMIAGLSYLRVSPVHGTAFDIAGRGG